MTRFEILTPVCCRSRSTGIWCRVVGWAVANVSQDM